MNRNMRRKSRRWVTNKRIKKSKNKGGRKDRDKSKSTGSMRKVMEMDEE